MTCFTKVCIYRGSAIERSRTGLSLKDIPRTYFLSGRGTGGKDVLKICQGRKTALSDFVSVHIFLM